MPKDRVKESRRVNVYFAKNGRQYIIINNKKRYLKNGNIISQIKALFKKLKRKPTKKRRGTPKARTHLNTTLGPSVLLGVQQQQQQANLQHKINELARLEKEKMNELARLEKEKMNEKVKDPKSQLHPTQTIYKKQKPNILDDVDQFRLMQQYYNKYKKNYPKTSDHMIVLPKKSDKLTLSPVHANDNNILSLHYSPVNTKDKQLVVVEDEDDDETEQAINPQKAKNHDVDELNHIRTNYNQKKILNRKERKTLSAYADKYGVNNKTSLPNTKNPRGIGNIINDILDLIAVTSPDNVIDTGSSSKNEVSDEDDKIIGELLGDGKQLHSAGLSNFEIDKIMSKYGDRYIGTISHDQIPMILSKIKPKSTGGMIINTQNYGQPGQHWQSLYFSPTSIEFFDSFGDPIDKKLLKDIKLIADKLNVNSYIKFKENRIQVQNDRSNNCGFFSCDFLLKKFNGQSFAQSTGWDDKIKNESLKGEKAIEVFKKQVGYGVFKYIKSFAKDVYNRVKVAVTGVRDDYPPNVKRWIKDHGDEKIVSITVVREPINSMINKALNWISLGSWEQNKRQLGFDQLFHLFAIIKFEKGEDARIEKNHVIEMFKNNNNSYPNSEKISVNPNGKTLSQLLENAYKKGGSALFKYNAGNSNCQNFLTTLLSASGLLTSSASSFINQDAKSLIEKLHPVVRKAIDTVTDIADRGDSLLNGGNQKRFKKYNI